MQMLVFCLHMLNQTLVGQVCKVPKPVRATKPVPSSKKISRYAVGMKCQDESEMLYIPDRVGLIDPESIAFMKIGFKGL